MSSINFDNAYLLLLAIPLIVLFTIPFALAIRKENRNGHNIASLILHIALAIVVAFAAAGTKITTLLTETNVYVVADVSYSANRNLDTIDNYIKALKLPRGSKLGVVCFGKDYELLCDLDDPSKVTSVKQSTVDNSETNIVDALTYAGTLFKDNVIKRIVLITDGRQTDDSDSYAVKRVVDSLEAQKIKVDAIFLDNNIKGDVKEVQVSSANYTKVAYLNRAETAEISVQTSYDTNATVSLRRNGEKVRDRSVNLTTGHNIVTFDLDTSESGTYNYEVSIEADGDVSDLNNSISFTQKVSEELKVLVVTHSWDDCMAAIERYGEKAVIDVYENDLSVTAREKNEFLSLYEGNENITIHSRSNDVPCDIEELVKYDEIVLANVDISLLTNFTEFVRSVDKVVSMFGKSLVTIGNLSIQNRDNAELNQLGDMLPVRFNNSDSEPKLYTFVIDTSRSMNNLSHLIIAKQVANRLIDLLNRGDEVCIVTFFSDVRITLAPRPITDEMSRNEIKDIITNLDVIQGTLIGKGLLTAYELIRDLRYSDKQVMLISDGLTYSDEEDDPIMVASNMYEDGIVTSVFDVGRQGDTSSGTNPDATSSAAKRVLQATAEAGNGKYVYSNNVEALEDVTFGEMADIITEAIVERETSVSVNRRTDDVLSGIDVTDMPSVMGYVYSTSKASATTVLTVNHKRTNGTVQRPLYAYWNYGNGKVSSFTSSFSGDWVENWADIKEEFFGNVFDVNVPSEKTDYPFTVNIDREGKLTRVEVLPAAVHLGSTATMNLTLPTGEEIQEEMMFNAYYYYYEFECPEIGNYDIDITYTYNNKEYTSTNVMNIPYADEYDAFAIFESSVLHKAIDGRGTVSDDGTLIVENDEKEIGKYVNDLTPPLLIAAVVLFVVDIIVRKLKWEDIKSFFGLGKKPEGKKK